jgi:hypothetical protein
VEVGLQVLVLVLARRGRHGAAALAALVAQTMTCWKTVLYWLYDIVGGFAFTGVGWLWGVGKASMQRGTVVFEGQL